jgi:hypothetical protein
MNEPTPNPETRIALFQRKEIRRTIHNNEWWFVIADVVAALTDSVDPQGYVKDMRRRDPEFAKGWGQIATPLSIATAGGPQTLNCANTEGLFRLIQSIPSPKAEPFKRWLAKVGYERIQEIEDPELATKRTRALYQPEAPRPEPEHPGQFPHHLRPEPPAQPRPRPARRLAVRGFPVSANCFAASQVGDQFTTTLRY